VAFSMIQYDIRDGAVFRDGTKIPNPAGVFRRRHRMCQTSFSVYMCKDEYLPYSLFELWRQSGMVRFWVVPQLDSPAFRQLCKDALELQIAEKVKSVDDSLNEAATKARASGDAEAFERSSTRIVNRMERILGDLQVIAKEFGHQDLNFETAYGRIRAMGATSHTRLAMQAALVEQVQGTCLAAAARADEVPPGVMMDMLEDQGRDMGAARAVFAGPPVAAADLSRPVLGSAVYTTTPATPAFQAENPPVMTPPVMTPPVMTPPVMVPPVSPVETHPVIPPAQRVAYGNGHGNGQAQQPRVCPRCGAGLTPPRRNRNGNFFRGCTRFPHCRGAVNA
jgi:hypothetical protein